MSERENKTDKGLLARTATYTSKRARRAQTKLKQRVGKGDETKDEVFDEFHLNFTKQQTVAARLFTELKNYLRCITAMQLAAANFGEAVNDVYEEDWTGRDTIIKSFSESNANWTKLSIKLTDEVLEPLISYQKPFPDVKNKIAKRARKLVDYDHSRHIVDTLRAKGATKSSDVKRLNQAEEEYQRAKDVFIELTSELYEELPALYDSRIGFYVSCFQSIFTLEEVFHRDASYISHQLNDLMDQLITDFSAGTYSTRKPFSAGLETITNTSEKEDISGSLIQVYDVAMPTDENEMDANSADSADDEVNELLSDQSGNDEDFEIKQYEEMHQISTENNIEDQPSATTPQPSYRPAPSPMNENGSTDNEAEKPETEMPPPDEINTCQNDELLTQNGNTEDMSMRHSVEIKSESGEITGGNIVAYKNVLSPDNSNKHNLIVPSALYKVVTTHKYTPEDEDELSFERGEVIHVIPYEDPDEQDEGWLMGVMDNSGVVGVFPENFSKVVT